MRVELGLTGSTAEVAVRKKVALYEEAVGVYEGMDVGATAGGACGVPEESLLDSRGRGEKVDVELLPLLVHRVQRGPDVFRTHLHEVHEFFPQLVQASILDRTIRNVKWPFLPPPQV
jgi:hypothetical protein